MKQAVAAKKQKNTAYSRKLFYCIIPFIILCFLFSYFPLHGWIYAFFDYKPPLSLSQCEFVGLKWFKTLFNNPTQVKQIIEVMRNTFAMSLLGIATSILPVGFAIFLNEIKCKWFKNLVQTLTTLPNFISWVLVYSVAFSLFTDSGMVNTLLQNMGIITTPIKLNNGMDQYYVFQNAFNKAHIQVLDLYVYNIGMTGNSLSLATAISMLKSVISVSLLAIVNFVSKKTRGASII